MHVFVKHGQFFVLCFLMYSQKSVLKIVFTETEVWKQIHLCSVLHSWIFHDLALNTVEPHVGF